MKRMFLLVAVLGVLAFLTGTIIAGGQEVAPKFITHELPAGRYTGLMFTAAGIPTANHATAVIKSGRDQFLLNLAPGASVSVPFADGWEVEDGEVTIRLTPGHGMGAVPSAWAITSEGPVALE